MYMPCCQIELTLQFTFIILISSRTAPPGYVYAYLSNECAPTMCPGLLSPTRPKSATNIPQPSVPVAKVPFGTHFSGNTGIVKQKLKSWLLQNRYIICRKCHYPVNSVLVLPATLRSVEWGVTVEISFAWHYILFSCSKKSLQTKIWRWCYKDEGTLHPLLPVLLVCTCYYCFFFSLSFILFSCITFCMGQI